MNNVIKKLIIALSTLSLLGCGTLTGIPSHGGGKRFANEQRLLSGTIRAGVLDFDVSKLAGKTVSFYVVGMGDSGSGNISGGRSNLSFLYNSSKVKTPQAKFPSVVESTTGDVNTTKNMVLNYPLERLEVVGMTLG